jgi:single-strand DNA-binding protein
MAALNKVILIGRLTADPELKQTPSGVAVTSFTIAVDRQATKEGKKETDFINIVAWRKTAEFISKYFNKGSAIIVCGSIQTRSWKDSEGKNRYATEVVASEVSFAEAKKASANISITAEENKSESFVEVDDADGLPF